jgi:hypothetical protein
MSNKCFERVFIEASKIQREPMAGEYYAIEFGKAFRPFINFRVFLFIFL